MTAPNRTDPGAPDPRAFDRRTGAERRVAVLPFPTERRSGLERRVSQFGPAEQLRAALELLAQVAETGLLDDAGLRQIDGAILRVRAAMERIGV